MKNISIVIILIISTIFSISAQDQYAKGMSKALGLWGEGKSLEAVALFERIAQAENDQWLPSYYAANVLIVQSFESAAAALNDERLKKAEKLIAEAHKRSPNNSEITTMEGLLYTAYVAMAPETYAMVYSQKIMELHTKAIELDPKNPRAHSNHVEYQMGSARFFGQDMKQFCDQLNPIIPLYENQKKEIPFAPFYGLERLEANIKECGC